MAAFSTLLLLAGGVGMKSVRFNPPKRRRGRPRTRPSTTLLSSPPAKHRGGQRRFSDDVLRAWVAEIDKIKAVALSHGKTISDAAALRLSIGRYFTKQLLSEGVAEAEVIKRARQMARGPLFRTRKVDLARARARMRDGSL